MKKPKRGRPAKAPGDRREVFALRLTAEERDAIERAASIAGRGASTWAREMILQAARRPA